MKTPRKHAAFIKAWADGAEIQERFKGDETWLPFDGFWTENDFEYCIKPEPKLDIVETYWVGTEPPGIWNSDKKFNLKLIFDGETGKLKAAEVIT